MLLPIILSLFVKTQWVSSEESVRNTGCPPDNTIEPCICSSGSHPILVCKHVDDPEVLVKIFDRATHYRFQEFHLEESVLQYLPHDMFQGVEVLRIVLKNVTLVQLFDEPPQTLQMVEGLHIENTHIFRRMDWHLLQNFTSLRILSIYYNKVPYLGSEFDQFVSDSLTQLIFYDTQTELVKPGVFMKYNDLERVSLDACGITQLTRNIFSRPFNGRFLYFNDNKLASIPDDLFVDMPNLETVGLRKNLLKTIPALAFQGSFSQMKYLFLEGNPLYCDCRIQWIVRSKPDGLTGTCDFPENLKGKELKDLKLSDLNCPLP